MLFNRNFTLNRATFVFLYIICSRLWNEQTCACGLLTASKIRQNTFIVYAFVLLLFSSVFLDSTCANLTLTKNNKTESNWNTFARLLFDVYIFELFHFFSFSISLFHYFMFCLWFTLFSILFVVVRVWFFLFACSSAISQSESDKHEQICIIFNNDNEADSSVVNVREFPQRPNGEVKQKRNIQTSGRW